MTTLFAALLAVVALAVCAIREDTPTARTPGRAWADLRAAGWWRVAWAIVRIFFGGPLIAVYAIGRYGLYRATVGIAFVACWTASRIAMENRPIRFHVEIRA